VFVWNAGKATKLAIPAKCDIDGLVKNQLVISINQDWKPQGAKAGFRQGSVLSLSLDDIRRDPTHLKPAVVFAPTATEFPQSVSVTKNKLLLLTLDRVQGRAYICDRGGRGRWVRKKLPVGDNLSVSIASTSTDDDRFFLDISGFITTQSLYLGDAATGTLALAKSRKPQFDASNLKVEQLWTTSKDGTKVPYFVVLRKDLRYNGENPTLLTAYGGFQISETPFYSGSVGKLWLERGGVFALANIRGGGEFGPAWHEAGLKTHRQRIYDDFAAVGRDLVRRKITSTRRLGIEGGSNGGLLMGVEMTQHPDMWHAIVIQVPLLDMLGFEHIAAGASWVGEYGSTSVPAERRFLASISPYNQLKRDVDYPEPFIFTTTKDDRVGPVHARKFAARMEEYGKPFFYDEITEGGHSGGADLKQQAHSAATTYIYLIRKLMD
ncbi:MAG TPA: prolyl oligopeptidase family serine peptidase, partial [Fimbriimonas sp.]|nr:prolyl oligopeptidase family serine peptidase [Fimbriimonas sp.]